MPVSVELSSSESGRVTTSVLSVDCMFLQNSDTGDIFILYFAGVFGSSNLVSRSHVLISTSFISSKGFGGAGM